LKIQVEVFWVLTNASEDLAASIFRVKKMKDAGRKVHQLVSYRNMTRPHKPEDLDVKIKPLL
jgi:hypothetical protein